MNQHAVSTQSDGVIFALSISRRWLRVAGSCAVASGAVIAIVANSTEPFRAPLGIALGVLAMTLLIAFAVKSPSRRQAAEPASTKIGKSGPRTVLGTMRRKRSVAAELALLAELHAKGALSDEEFTAAKLRTLGG